MTVEGIKTELLEKVVDRRPADVLAPLRRDALLQFAKTGFPTQRHEDWKYTNLAPAVEIGNEWLRSAGKDSDPAVDAAEVQRVVADISGRIDAHVIVIANGAPDSQSLARLSTQELRGIEIRSAVAAGSQPDLVNRDAMSNFNAALLEDILQIRVSHDSSPARPLCLLFVDDASNTVSMSQPRCIIDVAERAQVDLIELHVSAGRHDHFSNAVIELNVADDAQVNYVRVQDRQETHHQVNKLLVRLARAAVLDHAAFDLGGRLTRNDLAVDIAGAEASVRLHGLYLASGTQHIDNHTRVDHRVAPSYSVEEYRGILRDRARCVFNGKVVVHAGADGTDAQQSNHNLLLSDKAEIDTKPELEIYADDVKCSHGATVGQLDDAALFYLRSRGLERDEAARALTRAFAATIVDKVPVTAARSYIEGLIETRLQEMTGESA